MSTSEPSEKGPYFIMVEHSYYNKQYKKSDDKTTIARSGQINAYVWSVTFA